LREEKVKNYDCRTYSVNDFREWYGQEKLVLAPKFQRRRVWSEKAKAYLIDTIIRGKPMPKFFFRQMIDPDTKVTIREIVDGQQRLGAILDYLDDGFRINKSQHKELGGKRFSELPVNVQKDFLNYEISTDLLIEADDAMVLDVFARLNSYSVKLNEQELRNARYFGEFKQAVYNSALEYLQFWRIYKIFSEHQIARMLEAELTSDLYVAMVDGIRARKKLGYYYQIFDDEFPNSGKYESSFRRTMDTIGDTYGQRLLDSNFRRPHMFYSLFTVIFHFLYEIPGLVAPKIVLKSSDYSRVRNVLDRVDMLWETEDLVGEERRFLDAARRATTDEPVRIFRTKYICSKIATD